MAVSGSNNFSLSAVDIVTEARKKIGIHASEEPLSDAERVEAFNTLNIMLKKWQAEGISTSHLTEGSITLSENDTSLTVGSGGDFTTVPFEITDMRITRNSIDTPMIRLSREEYYALPNKTTTGFPTQWYYDRQRSGGTIYIWPAADSTAGTLKFTYRASIDDMDVNADDLDLPVEWYEPVILGLATRLAVEYGLADSPQGMRVANEAAMAFESLKRFDTGEGEGSIRIVPTLHRRYVR